MAYLHMLLFPNAKINLGLHVLRKRSDGYHDISTVMYPVKGLCDALEFVPATGKDELHISGLDIPGSHTDNLCFRAISHLRERADLTPLKVYLHKAIPMGAGLGGGSADAAFLLWSLNGHFELGLETAELERVAARLGADCSFFIRNVPAMAEGKGEVLTPVDLSLDGKYVVVIHPDIHISTAGAYAAIHPHVRDVDLRHAIIRPVDEWRDLLTNDFEAFAFKAHPQLERIKMGLYGLGAQYAAMTGSGSALFGIFAEAPDETQMKRWAGPHFVHVSQL